MEDKDLEVIGTPSVQYDDTSVIIQHIESGLWLSYKTYQVCFSFSYLLSCSTDQTTNSESTNPEFWKIVTYQICVFADKTKENQETMLVKLAIIGLKIYDNSNS